MSLSSLQTTLLHAGVELIIIGCLVFYMNNRISSISIQTAELRSIVNRHEKIIEEQQKIIEAQKRMIEDMRQGLILQKQYISEMLPTPKKRRPKKRLSKNVNVPDSQPQVTTEGGPTNTSRWSDTNINEEVNDNQDTSSTDFESESDTIDAEIELLRTGIID